jgi:hypothetical protein
MLYCIAACVLIETLIEMTSYVGSRGKFDENALLGLNYDFLSRLFLLLILEYRLPCRFVAEVDM